MWLAQVARDRAEETAKMLLESGASEKSNIKLSKEGKKNFKMFVHLAKIYDQLRPHLKERKAREDCARMNQAGELSDGMDMDTCIRTMAK